MGCGNSKVSRSYLTSQPITTPSARATKTSVADLGAQIQRLAALETTDSAAPAEEAAAAEELEDAKRILITTALRVALEPVRLPGQPEKTVQNIRGKDKAIKSWVRKVGEDGSFHELRDADGNYTHGPLHIHSIVEPTGQVVLVATDRRQGTDDPHFAKIKIAIPNPPDAMYDAAFDVIADLLRERA